MEILGLEILKSIQEQLACFYVDPNYPYTYIFAYFLAWEQRENSRQK